LLKITLFEHNSLKAQRRLYKVSRTKRLNALFVTYQHAIEGKEHLKLCIPGV